MDKKIQFQKDADILSENGEQIGFLERVVLNPQTKVITDLVVRTGTLFDRQEKVVSIDLVTKTTERIVVLRHDKKILENLPAFEEMRKVPDQPAEQYPGEGIRSVRYDQPGISPVILPNQSDEINTRVERNIPEGTVAMKEGARVLAVEGKPVGNVESVFADPDIDQATHFLISSGLFFKEFKIIPMQWVELVGDDRVLLRVNKTSIDEIADLAVPD